MCFDREYWKQMLPYVTAFANGENVETISFGEWGSRDEYHFDSSPASYRIAPAPKLRPWTSEELGDRVIRGALVRHKRGGDIDAFLVLESDGIVRMAAAWASAQDLLECYELIGIDGARLPEPEPCGVRE